MTDVLPERETLTQPIAHRAYTPGYYDTDATAILRPGEGPIIVTGEIPSLADELFGYGKPPTVPPPLPPVPPAPEPPSKLARLFRTGPERPTGDLRPEPIPLPPAGYRSRHREHPRWPGWLPVMFAATVGTLFGGLMVAGALAWMSGALG